MHLNKATIIGLILIFFLSACIKKFDPEINSSDVVKFVVTGQLNKGDEVQFINISTTSPTNHPVKTPVTGCRVLVIDNRGNSFIASDMQDGNYRIILPANELIGEASFKIDILAPDGTNIVSDFDQIQECPDVDSIFYQIEQLPSLGPSPIRGIRFYMNLNANQYSCRNYRWEAIETWEYKAVFANVSSLKVCWMTGMIKDVFTLSTKNLSENKFNSYPFHFVDNYSSQRLKFGYSLLVRQYSLSEAAYAYWEKVRSNYSEQGGLYSKQPLQIKGNLHNLTNPNQPVLGFFGVSEVKSKRIFVGKINGLAIEYLDCDPPVPLGPKPEPTCYNCLLEGGTNVKPYFWPE